MVNSDKEDLPREEIVIAAQKRVSCDARVRQTQRSSM
jgi:hypothetical protein